VWCVCVCVCEIERERYLRTSTTKRPRHDLGCWATKKYSNRHRKRGRIQIFGAQP